MPKCQQPETKYNLFYKRKFETCFNENDLRSTYVSKLEAMSCEEREQILSVANMIVAKIKERRGATPFGMDSALQLMYILGTFLNETA